MSAPHPLEELECSFVRIYYLFCLWCIKFLDCGCLLFCYWWIILTSLSEFSSNVRIFWGMAEWFIAVFIAVFLIPHLLPWKHIIHGPFNFLTFTSSYGTTQLDFHRWQIAAFFEEHEFFLPFLFSNIAMMWFLELSLTMCILSLMNTYLLDGWIRVSASWQIILTSYHIKNKSSPTVMMRFWRVLSS